MSYFVKNFFVIKIAIALVEEIGMIMANIKNTVAFYTPRLVNLKIEAHRGHRVSELKIM
jgi:hypothetical protein